MSQVTTQTGWSSKSCLSVLCVLYLSLLFRFRPVVRIIVTSVPVCCEQCETWCRSLRCPWTLSFERIGPGQDLRYRATHSHCQVAWFVSLALLCFLDHDNFVGFLRRKDALTQVFVLWHCPTAASHQHSCALTELLVCLDCALQLFVSTFDDLRKSQKSNGLEKNGTCQPTQAKKRTCSKM